MRRNVTGTTKKVARCTIVGICVVSWTLCLGCQSGPQPAPGTPALPTSASAGATTIVAVAAPAAPGMSLPQFLGLPALFGGIRAIGQRIRSRLGSRFPGLEPKPPLLAITDPANTGPNASPAVKAAAEAKAEEDKAPQKAKAIRYLASLGCGECYPDTEKALLAALEDCTEVIRYETVKGLRESAGDPCQCCRENSCCSPDLLKKLYQLAYEMTGSGCYYEPSARVRRNARLVIRGCGGVQTDIPQELPQEGPPSMEQAPEQSVITASMTVDESDSGSNLESEVLGASLTIIEEPPQVLASDGDAARRL